MTKRLLMIGLLLSPIFLSGCVLDTILSDVVNHPPIAVIDASPTTGPAPLIVSLDAGFSHDEDGSIIEYHWQIGDPAAVEPLTRRACEYTFAQPGTYLVKLTVVDDDGASDSQQVAIVVTNAPPVAQAKASHESPYTGVAVTFSAEDSYDYDGTIVDYRWDFGDGGSAVGETVTHTYADGGYYVVTLVVTDDEGLKDSVKFGINVLPGHSNCTTPPGGSDGGSCDGASVAPLAVITGLPSCSGGEVGVPVTFDGTASRPAVGKIVTYQWDFGDGTTATGPVVTHTYTKSWTYMVKLTVVDEGGGVGTAIGSCPIGPGSCSQQ